MCDTIELVQHETLLFIIIYDIRIHSSDHHWCGPLHLAFPGDVAYACTNIQQVWSEEEEEKRTPHIGTWRNARVWIDFFGGLH